MDVPQISLTREFLGQMAIVVVVGIAIALREFNMMIQGSEMLIFLIVAAICAICLYILRPHEG